MALAARGLRQPNPCYGAGGSEGVPLGGAPDERDDLENFELNQASERGDEGEDPFRAPALTQIDPPPSAGVYFRTTTLTVSENPSPWNAMT